MRCTCCLSPCATPAALLPHDAMTQDGAHEEQCAIQCITRTARLQRDANMQRACKPLAVPLAPNVCVHVCDAAAGTLMLQRMAGSGWLWSLRRLERCSRRRVLGPRSDLQPRGQVLPQLLQEEHAACSVAPSSFCAMLRVKTSCMQTASSSHIVP